MDRASSLSALEYGMLHEMSEAFLSFTLVAAARIHGNSAIFHGSSWPVSVHTPQPLRGGKIIIFFVVHYFL